MLLKVAIDTIQRDVKHSLGLSKIPSEATTKSIKKMLADMGLTEPYDRTQCKEIVTMIIEQYNRNNSAIELTPVDSCCEDEQPTTEALTVVEETTEELFTVNNEETTTTQQKESTESALTFTNDFEKAALAQSELKNSGIQVSTVQAIELVADIEDTYASKEEFLLLVLSQWEKLQTNQSEDLKQIVFDRVATVKAREISDQNEIKRALMDADTFINDNRRKFNNDFQNFVNDIISRG